MRLAFGAEQAAGAGAAQDLAGFLGRLVRWDKAAVVRLRSATGEAALGVFGHPPFGGVMAVKSAALRSGHGDADAVDATVSAGQLLDAVGAVADGGSDEIELPGSVTGPAWAGLLPPRAGWLRVAELDAAQVRDIAAEVVAEFRARTEALAAEQRTRAELDALAEELWGRPLGSSGMTLRVVHAAHALGFLPASGSGEGVAVLGAGPWLRLRTGFGSVAVRSGSAAAGLSVTPA